MTATPRDAKRHDGKIALVTGGTSGIGLATAKRLAQEGATVVVTGRRQAALDAAVQEIERASGVRGDIGNLDDLDQLFATIKERHGRVDIVFANAGSGHCCRSVRSRSSTSTRRSA